MKGKSDGRKESGAPALRRARGEDEEGMSLLTRGTAGREGGYGQENIGPRRMPVEPQGEEGRGKLREAAGRGTHPLIRGCPNGVTRTARAVHPDARIK